MFTKMYSLIINKREEKRIEEENIRIRINKIAEQFAC